MNIGNKLVDLTEFINPELTVVDATRFLEKHGPSGGNIADVVKMDTVIAGTDPTLVDAYSAYLVNWDPMEVPYINAAVKRNIGNGDISKADILKIKS